MFVRWRAFCGFVSSSNLPLIAFAPEPNPVQALFITPGYIRLRNRYWKAGISAV